MITWRRGLVATAWIVLVVVVVSAAAGHFVWPALLIGACSLWVPDQLEKRLVRRDDHLRAPR